MLRTMKTPTPARAEKELEKRGDFRLPPIVDTGANVDMAQVHATVSTCDYHITPACVRRKFGTVPMVVDWN